MDVMDSQHQWARASIGSGEGARTGQNTSSEASILNPISHRERNARHQMRTLVPQHDGLLVFRPYVSTVYRCVQQFAYSTSQARFSDNATPQAIAIYLFISSAFFLSSSLLAGSPMF